MPALILRRDFIRNALGTLLTPERILASPLDLKALTSPVLFAGNASLAYRDPAAIFYNGWFYLYFTHVLAEPPIASRKRVFYSHVAWSKSRDLVHWTSPVHLTPSNKALDYSSPGNVVRHKNQWILCLQTYPRPHGEKYGNRDARIWIVRSADLEHWSSPELLRVKGPDVPFEKMGRMIDPFLLADKDMPGKWWCFYKQKGISLSSSSDLVHWSPQGRIHAGENPCVLVDRDAAGHTEYVLFHSPANGIGIKRSNDLHHWRNDGILTLSQKQWPWAKGRITAGFVLDLRHDPAVGKALMFFHGSAYSESDRRGGFDNFASLGIAWSSDHDDVGLAALAH